MAEEMKLEAVVVTEAVAEEEESRRAFAKTVHMTALQAHTKPMQPTRNSTGSQPPAPRRGRAPSASFAAAAAAAPSSPAAAAATAARMAAPGGGAAGGAGGERGRAGLCAARGRSEALFTRIQPGGSQCPRTGSWAEAGLVLPSSRAAANTHRAQVNMFLSKTEDKTICQKKKKNKLKNWQRSA